MASTINASSSGSGGLISTGDASGVLQLQNNGTTAVTVNGGYVGVGTGSPAKQINIEGSSASTTTIGVGMLITNTNTTNNSRAGIAFANFDNYGAAIWSPRTSSTAGALVFGTNPETGTAETNIVEAGRFNKTGNFVLKGGTTTADGVGVTFPASQSASSDANCLDDYEEGTFNPVPAGSSVTGTVNYINRVGSYVKVGRQVTCWVHLNWNSGTGSGNLEIQGFPFTTANNNNYAVPTLYFDSIAITNGNIFEGYIGPNDTKITFIQYNPSNSATAVIPYDASGVILATVSYLAAS